MNRYCAIHLFVSLLVCCGVASTACGQSEAESKAPYQMPSPKGWGRERIKLPPSFAPKMNWKGHEDLRFAPGMFNPKSDSFLSYDVLFWTEGERAPTQKELQQEITTYYQGLSKAVLAGRKPGLKPMQAVVKLKAVESHNKTPLDKRPEARYVGELVWTEPFVTATKQTLRLELDVHKHDGRICVFLCASPQTFDAKVWKQLRKIRDGVKFAK